MKLRELPGQANPQRSALGSRLRARLKAVGESAGQDIGAIDIPLYDPQTGCDAEDGGFVEGDGNGGTQTPVGAVVEAHLTKEQKQGSEPLGNVK